MSEQMRIFLEIGALVGIIAIFLVILWVWLKGSGRYDRGS
jgi:hypothetical protein